MFDSLLILCSLQFD